MASAKKAKLPASGKSKGKLVKAPKAARAKAAKQPVQARKAAKPTKPAQAKAAKKPVKTAKPVPSKAPVAKAGPGVGSKAPSFTLSDQLGKSVSTASLAGAPYVLYFYPKDNTTGCTKEACDFRDSFRSFGQKRARVLGVSPDSEASHSGFVKKYGLPFTLLADPEKVLANAYGVWVKKQNYGREYMGIQRSTFVVDAQGVIRNVWHGVKVDGHVGAVLAAVQKLS